MSRKGRAVRNMIEKLDAFARGPGLDAECTVCALSVVTKFGGEIRGFFRENNPNAVVVAGVSGHDFAIVNDRYLVDGWAACVAKVTTRAVFDLADPSMFGEVSRLYGDRTKWLRNDVTWSDLGEGR